MRLLSTFQIDETLLRPWKKNTEKIVYKCCFLLNTYPSWPHGRRNVLSKKTLDWHAFLLFFFLIIQQGEFTFRLEPCNQNSQKSTFSYFIWKYGLLQNNDLWGPQTWTFFGGLDQGIIFRRIFTIRERINPPKKKLAFDWFVFFLQLFSPCQCQK